MRLTSNAWIGNSSAAGELATTVDQWAKHNGYRQPKQYLLAPIKKPREWLQPNIGWGLILPYRKEFNKAERIAALDAPEPIRELLKARGGGPVLRFQNNNFEYLVNEATDRPVSLQGGERGIGNDKLPLYLLICGSPEEVPWKLQFLLNANSFVGRLDLKDAPLVNYVQNSLSNWKEASSDPYRPLIWAVDYGLGENDITTLMRMSIAERFHKIFARDPDSDFKNKIKYINGAQQVATQANLIKALKNRRPGFIVTTSHGMTWPLDDLQKMRSCVGMPVDQNGQELDGNRLLQEWQPDGAIWYAHACCSAGVSATTQYEGLLKSDSDLGRVIARLTTMGSMIAPLPQMLLGAEKPLRAFIGHVEPTFNWTLQQPPPADIDTTLLQSTSFSTDNIVDAFYGVLYSASPPRTVGRALHTLVNSRIGALLSQYFIVREQYKDAQLDPAVAFSLIGSKLLCAFDLQSVVLLGDPAVEMPL